MASSETNKRPGALEEMASGKARVAYVVECPVIGEKCLVPLQETCRIQDEEKCPTALYPEPNLQEEGLKLEGRLQPDPRAGAGRDSRPVVSIVRPSHGLKRKPVKTEAELLQKQREEQVSSQGEPLPSAKQYKKAKKRKNMGAPVVPGVARNVSAPPEKLESPALPRLFVGKAQRLRPLYQYINYCNPELNQAEEEDREAEVEPESELVLAPEEAGVKDVKQPQGLLPTADELGLGLTVPCPIVSAPPTHALAPLGEEATVEAGGLASLGMSGCLKAEVDKSTQADINKMLSVCAAPFVPPLSPQ
ncbi:uncharacterized protein C16orf86 homolog [Ctenodactylus gundi]